MDENLAPVIKTTYCKLCDREGALREGNRLPIGWRIWNNHKAHGPVCVVCNGPYQSRENAT